MEEEKRTEAENTVDEAGRVPFKDELEVKGVKGFFKGQMPLIKNAVFILFINVIFSLFGIIALSMPENLLWLGVLLYVLFLAADVAFTFLIGKSAAYGAYNAFRLNRVNAKHGRHVPYYKRMQEYRPVKGYLTGLVGSAVLIVLVIAAQLADSAGFSAVVKFAFSLFFTPFGLINPDLPILLMLLGVVVNVMAFGLGYHIFGTKMQIQQDAIDDELRQLHSGSFDVDGSDETDV